MKISLDLACESPKEWLAAVMADFDTFLRDHADCERKASAMSMSLVAKYPDKTEIIPELIETALEEMQHFQAVYQIMQDRGIQLNHEITEDPYVKQLLSLMHSDVESRFLDRLLLASIIECRGAERFRMIWEALPAGKLKKFYHELWASEAKHGNIFAAFALRYFPNERVYARLKELTEKEARIIQGLKIRAALH